MKLKSIATIIALGLAASPATAAWTTTEALVQEQSGPATDDLEASRAAIAETDFDRLGRDRDYAAQILQHVERLDPAFRGDPPRVAALDTIRMISLNTLGRQDEIRSRVDRLIARHPREADAYAGPFFGALMVEDRARTVALVETAGRNVPGVGWARLREIFDRDTMGPLIYELRSENALRVRLAEALLRIGWPGDGVQGSADHLRTILVDDRLVRGDRAGATDFASGISNATTILSMIVQPRYDAVLAPGRDRIEVLRGAVAERDRNTAEAVAAAPQNARHVLERAQFLHSLGRDEEVVTLLQPFTADVPATVAASEDGMWLINEAAYALVALDRNDEAVALMARMAELSMEEHPYLISTRINHSEILWATGRHQAALDFARQLEGQADGFASDYGKMWVASSIACALAGLDRASEAAPQIERLRGLADVNPSALMQAYLCLGDSDAAAALMVRRLEGDDPKDAILALQDYDLARGVTQTGGPYERLTALRERPAVRAALDRVGRVYDLPLARGYWGGF